MKAMQKNESGLKPLGRAVLIRTYEPEISIGKIIIPDTIRDRVSMVEQRAIVIEVGPEAWIDEKQPRAQPGDKVVVSKFAGWMTPGPLDGKIYRMVNANDIFAAITGEMTRAEEVA